MNNLKQIGTGISMYGGDFDGYMPPSVIFVTGSTWQMWPTLMMPYVKNQQVFVCPSASNGPKVRRYPGFSGTYCDISDTAEGTTRTGDGSTVAQGLVHRLSYTRNLIPNLVNTGSGGWSASLNWGNGLGPATNPQKNGFVAAGSTDSINDADIEDAAGTFHIMDGMAGLVSGVCSPNNGDMRAIFTDTRTDITNTVGNVRPAMRHLDGYNVLFGDGHVKWKQYRTSKYENWTVQKD